MILYIYVESGFEGGTLTPSTEESARQYMYMYDGGRQVTKPTFPLQSCRSRSGFRYSRSRSKAVTPDTIVSSYFDRDNFLNPRATALEQEQERQIPVRERNCDLRRK